MEEVWVVYLCLILLIIVLLLMRHNPHMEEAKKERESRSPPPPSSFVPSGVGKQLEHSQEELEHYLDRLTHVLFASEARKRDGHHDQKSHHHRSADVMSETKERSGKEAAHAQYPNYMRVQVPLIYIVPWNHRVDEVRRLVPAGVLAQAVERAVAVCQGKTTPSGSTENIVEEIEQAVQETVDTDLYVKRRQHPTASRRYHEGYRPETAAQPETDTA